MAKRKSSRAARKKRAALEVIGVILVLVCAFITVAPQLNLPFSVHTWQEIFSSAQLTEVSEAAKQPLSVHYIDVGQGDSILIKAEGLNVLIDAGERGNGETILSYLEAQNVKGLDYVIATHPHSDHIGSMADVLKKIPVANVIMPKLTQKNTPTTKTYENFLQAVKDSGAKVIAATPGETYSGKRAALTILGPCQQDDDLNNMSVVARLDFGSTSFLFTGDAETPSENAILKKGMDVHADVLKMGHHGSRTSSGNAFLDKVQPAFCVISCGTGNDYGHPHKETLEKLKKRGITPFRTDQDGTIVIGSDGTTLYCGTEKTKQELTAKRMAA